MLLELAGKEDRKTKDMPFTEAFTVLQRCFSESGAVGRAPIQCLLVDALPRVAPRVAYISQDMAGLEGLVPLLRIVLHKAKMPLARTSA